ncbi:MAG: helix-hairpin-helix domain-containing protein [Actinomycetota bacterium]
MTDDASQAPAPAPPPFADRLVRLRGDPRFTAGVVALVFVAAGVAWLRVGTSSSPAPGAIDQPPVTESMLTTVPTSVLVHVVGAVRAPGVVELERGARVADAVDVAGGATPDADLQQLNLAATVADGQRVAVPRIGEIAATEPATGTTDVPSGPINLNTATAAQLETLPGIGPALADAIVKEREKIGGFRKVDDLQRVRGIGDARFEQLRDLVIV